MLQITRYHKTRFWALWDGSELVAVVVYKKGATELLRRLELPIVFDHMGRLPPPDGIRHPAFQVIRRLLDNGRTWVKLSGSILHDSGKRRPPTAAELAETAQAYIRAAPERVVWGSDWPHRGDKGVPDDVKRFDALAQWAGDETTLRRILVDNPQALYGFPKSAYAFINP